MPATGSPRHLDTQLRWLRASGTAVPLLYGCSSASSRFLLCTLLPRAQTAASRKGLTLQALHSSSEFPQVPGSLGAVLRWGAALSPVQRPVGRMLGVDDAREGKGRQAVARWDKHALNQVAMD